MTPGYILANSAMTCIQEGAIRTNCRSLPKSGEGHIKTIYQTVIICKLLGNVERQAMTASNQPAAETKQQEHEPVENRISAEAATAADAVSPASTTAQSDITHSKVERDVWWGSYSGWTMLPGSVFATAFAAAIWWAGIAFVDNELLRLLLFGLSVAVLAFQAFRWAYRFFGYEYRLTTRRLLQAKGFLYGRPAEMELSAIAEIKPTRKGVDAVMGVGRIFVTSKDKSKPPILLEGVIGPFAVAELIQKQVDNECGKESSDGEN